MVKKNNVRRSQARLELLTWTVMVVLVIFLIFISPFLLLFFGYSLTVKCLARYFRPDLTHPLQGMSIAFALERITLRAKFNVVICMVMDGRLSIEKLRTLFRARVLEKRRKPRERSKYGKFSYDDLVYPELGQIWTSFMGYYFWKNESNFKLEEHIRLCDFEGEDGYRIPGVCKEEDLQELSTRLLSQPWKPDFSPWEIVLVPNYEPEISSSKRGGKKKSVLVLRFFHAMGDGKSWLKILDDVAGLEDGQLVNRAYSKSENKVVKPFVSPIKFLYDLAKNLVDSYDPVNPWHTNTKRSKRYFSSVTAPIPVQYVKDLKNKLGVSYTSILITAISGGIRRVMTEAGQPVPDAMKAFTILPLPRHPGGISFHVSGIYLIWPTGVEGSKMRLEEVVNNIKENESSLFPVACYYLTLMVEIFPLIVLRSFYNRLILSTAGASLFPGPPNFPKLEGIPVIDCFFFAGLPSGQQGAAFSSLAWGDQQRIVATVDKTLFPSNKIFQKLGGFIEHELQALENLSLES